MSAAVQYPQRHAVTAGEFLRMEAAGVFAPEARLELIDGEIIEMAPIGSLHAGTVADLTRRLGRLATPLGFDLGAKVPLYARGGVEEAWVIDLDEQVIHVFRDAGEGGYRTSFVVSGERGIASVALPRIRMAPRELF